MTENFLFKALFISLAAHTAIICVTYFNRMNDPHYKALRENRIEISYKPIRKHSVDIREHPIKLAQHLDLSNDQKLFSAGDFPVSLVKEKPALPMGMFYERRPEHMREMELSHRISIMPIKSEKINNPVYSAYGDMVRSRISEQAYKNYDKLEAGTVYLAFLVDKQGMLLDARIVPEKTNASEHLQDIAMRSLKGASPFPPAFKGMSLEEYSYDIVVEFQVSDG